MNLLIFSIMQSNLNIGGWNINGFSKEKRTDQLFLDVITNKNLDILCLSETWTKAETNNFYKLKGFCKPLHKPATKAKGKKGRPSGGMLVYFRKEIQNGIDQVKISRKHNIIWFKLKKSFFGIQKDLYICSVYIKPESAHNSDLAFEELERDMGKYSMLGDVMMIGDFNSRVGNLKDFIINDDLIGIENNFIYSVDKNFGPRGHIDSFVNKHGKKLIELCISSGLRILNGRKIGDLGGYLTYFGSQGSSTNDFIISHFNCFDRFQSMNVSNPNEFSDHCLVSCQFDCNFHKSSEKVPIDLVDNNDSPPNVKKFKWSDLHTRIYRDALNSTEGLQNISACENFSHDDSKCFINGMLERINDVMINASKNLNIYNFRHKNKKSKPKKKWMDKECWAVRRDLRSMARKIHTNPCLRAQFIALRKHYKQLCKKKALDHKNRVIKKLEDLNVTKNYQDFWSELKNLKMKDDLNDISRDMWESHYKKLCNDKDSKKMLDNLPDPSNLFDGINTILDFEISDEEISSAIRKLKNGKANGPDLILNEMVKYSYQFMAHPIKLLFNHILDSGIYPDTWKRSFLISVFKSGDYDDPNDYRGICLSSCLAKLFSSILNDRLYNYMENKLSKFQIGFKRGCRTSDHIFTLNSLVKKYLKRRNGPRKLYACFVDFSKAFDSLWRPFILEKLFKYNVGGKFYRIIKNILSSTEAGVKLPDGVSNYFALTLGIKQGDPISPTLFNIFIDDLASEILSANNDHPNLSGNLIPLLMYADDIVLLSESIEGLQSSLNTLNHYTSRWKLRINLKKTKVMIFENKRSLAPIFLLGRNIVEVVEKYKYLGIIFYYTGNFKLAQNELYLKGLKALFSISSKIDLNSINPNLAKKLFCSLVKPIICYGSEVWGEELQKILLRDFDKNDLSPGEKLLNKFCKFSLGVNRKAMNFAVKREMACTPICIEVIFQLLKFETRLNQLDNSRLVHYAYLENVSSKSNWYQFIVKLKEKANSTDPIVIKNYFLDKFINKSNNYISNSSRLKFYNLCREEGYCIPSYLEILKPHIKRAVTKLRISAHGLNALTSKFNKKNNSPNCNLCNVPEDELHVLLQCSKFDLLRNELYNKMNNFMCHDFDLLHINRQIHYLMSTNQSDLCEETGFFIFAILKRKRPEYSQGVSD